MKLKDIIGDVIKIINAATDEKKKQDGSADAEQSGTATAKDEMYKKLDEIDKKYRDSSDRTYNGTVVPNLKEKTYDEPTDDEIKSAAENEYSADAESKKQELGKRAEEKKKAYADKIGEIENQTKEGEKRVRAAYDAAKENASNEAIKRGIARSSIVSEQLKDLDKAAIDDIQKLYESGDRSVEEVNERIAELSDELSSAIDKLDLETAVKVNKRIAELKEERQARRDEVLEYNNALKEKRAKILTSLANNGVKIKEENSDEYINARSDKLRTLYDYYKSVGSQAEKELESDKTKIEKYVGTDGYNYLKKMLA